MMLYISENSIFIAREMTSQVDRFGVFITFTPSSDSSCSRVVSSRKISSSDLNILSDSIKYFVFIEYYL